jgi:hypothetical protein
MRLGRRAVHTATLLSGNATSKSAGTDYCDDDDIAIMKHAVGYIPGTAINVDGGRSPVVLPQREVQSWLRTSRWPILD